MGEHKDKRVCKNRKAISPLDPKARNAANKAQPLCTNYAQRKKWTDAYIDAGGAWKCVCKPSQSKSAKTLVKGKKNADEKFKKDKCGATTGKCSQATKDKWLKVKWNREEAYCGDIACLLGEAKGFNSVTEAQAEVALMNPGTIATLKTKGQSSFKVDWTVADVVFKGEKAPKKKPVLGTLSAGGLTAKTKKALAVKRVPDKTPEPVTFKCSSPKSVNGTANYSWTAAFRLGFKSDAVKLHQTLQIKKAWLGKWVSMDAKADKLKQAWGFVKKSGAQWKYWDTSAKTWDKLPRNVSKYKLNNIVFIKSGKKFVSRDDGGTFTWPESFTEPKDYKKKKTAWLKNIHDVWDKKFVLRHKDCKSKAGAICEWKIDVNVNWSNNAGDKLVYAVWAADWERSNAKDWYLTEQRLGVAGHECGHLLGAYDEYTNGAIHPKTKKIDKNSIMGQNLTDAYPRHLDGVRDQAKDKINSWISRTWKYKIKKA